MAQPAFLPVTPQEINALGWNGLDVLLISGDAYVDHPSFAMALLGRWLVEHGFRTAILPQPEWEGENALAAMAAFPRPRLFAGVSAGAIDSMLAHYTAFRKKRHDDAYTPGGKAGKRPNRATLVYTGLLRRAFPGLPVLLGGLEASLRRVSHYDFWSDSLRNSILPDSKADLILCGMAEQSLLQAAQKAEALLLEHPQYAQQEYFDNKNNRDAYRKDLALACATLPGAVTLHAPAQLALLAQALPTSPIALHSHEAILQDPAKLIENTINLEAHTHQGVAFLTQSAGQRTLLLAPPPAPLSSAEMDAIYNLPYTRLPHPCYAEPVPAWEMIRTSITTHRGCGGGCSFCSLALHQGRKISSRGRESILQEAAIIAKGPHGAQNLAQIIATAQSQGQSPRNAQNPPKWAGSISDVGGPSANMWQGFCSASPQRCKRPSCLHPAPCPHFKVDQTACIALLRDIAAQPGIRHVRVASGVRFDLALQNRAALKAYTMDYTGGQLKVAPEHICEDVLTYMRKPPQAVFEEFLRAFGEFSSAARKEQYVIPYLISAFPGCTDKHMRDLKNWLQKRGWSPKQVQCFIPTPGTVATAMYYAGQDAQGRKICVARSDKERLQQHHILLGPTSESGRNTRR